jgi:uncharacterized membrane protein
MHMITETDLTMEQAMSMLLTGGAVCPEIIRYSAPVPSAQKGDGTSVGVSLAMEESPAAVIADRAEKEQLKKAPSVAGGVI